MDNGVQYRWLDGGQASSARLHLQHGPIDLVIEACGDPAQVAKAYKQAHEACKPVLNALVECLPMLRQPVLIDATVPLSESCDSPVAKRMLAISKRFLMDAEIPELFITPMICVAGSVADHVLRAMLMGTELDRVYVNNGGDIALWLSPQARFSVGICNNVETGEIGSRVTLQARHKLQGVATSGWRGRSHSLGIADAVTVLAETAGCADAAATLIANAVDVPGCCQIHRLPACELSPESDLGDTPVTVAVADLTEQQINQALEGGKQLADQLINKGLIGAAYLSVADKVVVCAQPEQLDSDLDLGSEFAPKVRVCSAPASIEIEQPSEL